MKIRRGLDRLFITLSVAWAVFVLVVPPLSNHARSAIVLTAINNLTEQEKKSDSDKWDAVSTLAPPDNGVGPTKKADSGFDPFASGLATPVPIVKDTNGSIVAPRGTVIWPEEAGKIVVVYRAPPYLSCYGDGTFRALVTVLLGPIAILWLLYWTVAWIVSGFRSPT